MSHVHLQYILVVMVIPSCHALWCVRVLKFWRQRVPSTAGQVETASEVQTTGCQSAAGQVGCTSFYTHMEEDVQLKRQVCHLMTWPTDRQGELARLVWVPVKEVKLHNLPQFTNPILYYMCPITTQMKFLNSNPIVSELPTLPKLTWKLTEDAMLWRIELVELL